MKTLVLSLMLFCLSFAYAIGQDKASDAIINKYKNDTLNFKPFPKAYLLAQIKPAKAFSKWEIDTWYDEYLTKRRVCKSYYRFPVPKTKPADTVVLSKYTGSDGFTACWCPSYDPWYISAQARNGTTLNVIDAKTLDKFLGGKLHNPFNAYLWLFTHDDLYVKSLVEPIEISPNILYKKVPYGYLICLTHTRLANSPITSGNVTYFVGANKQVVLVSKEVLSVMKSFSI